MHSQVSHSLLHRLLPEGSGQSIGEPLPAHIPRLLPEGSGQSIGELLPAHISRLLPEGSGQSIGCFPRALARAKEDTMFPGYHFPRAADPGQLTSKPIDENRTLFNFSAT
eukprot:gene15191-21269_t